LNDLSIIGPPSRINQNQAVLKTTFLRQRKKLEKQREKNEREERRSQKASKAAAASNLDDMMSRMQL
jgi:hypothetical protein